MEKKTTAGQRFHRCQWQLDVIRENQSVVEDLLFCLRDGVPNRAKAMLSVMHKNDRDALLQENGILTSSQIELLKE